MAASGQQRAGSWTGLHPSGGASASPPASHPESQGDRRGLNPLPWPLQAGVAEGHTDGTSLLHHCGPLQPGLRAAREHILQRAQALPGTCCPLPKSPQKRRSVIDSTGAPRPLTFHPGRAAGKTDAFLGRGSEDLRGLRDPPTCPARAPAASVRHFEPMLLPDSGMQLDKNTSRQMSSGPAWPRTWSRRSAGLTAQLEHGQEWGEGKEGAWAPSRTPGDPFVSMCPSWVLAEGQHRPQRPCPLARTLQSPGAMRPAYKCPARSPERWRLEPEIQVRAGPSEASLLGAQTAVSGRTALPQCVCAYSSPSKDPVRPAWGPPA